MPYYRVNNRISDQETANNGTTTTTSAAASDCCSRASPELKLYQAFIFSVPVFFTFILLFLFYLFYLRRRRADWSSLRMRNTNSLSAVNSADDISRCEMGLKKELREMLPIIVFKESFSVRDTQCSVCLGEYQAEDRLQQIPVCGHTFHMDCIDLWLATHSTCPLCRLSLIAAATATKPRGPHDGLPDARLYRISTPTVGERYPNQNILWSHEDPQTSQQPQESSCLGGEILCLAAVERSGCAPSDCVERDVGNATNTETAENLQTRKLNNVLAILEQ